MIGWYALAERQYGAITRQQLRDCGLSDRQIDRLAANGRLTAMHRAVFRVAGSYPSARQRAMAAQLWCGGDALLSHRTAASLLRLPVTAGDEVHVTVPSGVRRSTEGLVVHRTETLPRRDRFVVEGLPCTAPARCLIDLASVLDGEELEHAFEWARRHGLVTATVVARRFDELGTRGRSGSAAVRELMRVMGARPAESRLEVRVHRLLRAHRLLPDALQHRVGRFRIDFAWIRKLIGVECDGFEWHGNRLAWKRDRRRVAALEASGWRLVHLTWDDVTRRPMEAIDRIRHALA